MAQITEYKKDMRLTIGFNHIQFNSLQILKENGVNLSQFIRLATAEKIKRDWKKIKKDNKKDTPWD